MKYAEEDHAKDLHRDLTRRFAASIPATAVSIGGAGVHWHCTAKRCCNLCSIACFDVGGLEYRTSFERDSEKVATGRPSSKLDTVNAVDDWLQGQQLSWLYDRFRFVDQTKRALASIREDMIARVPELTEAAPAELQHKQKTSVFFAPWGAEDGLLRREPSPFQQSFRRNSTLLSASRKRASRASTRRATILANIAIVTLGCDASPGP